MTTKSFSAWARIRSTVRGVVTSMPLTPPRRAISLRVEDLWHVGGEDFRRSMSTVAIKDGLLYAADLTGFLYCLDLETGKRHWRYDMLAAVWASPYVADGKVYLGDEDGDLVVLEHGKEMEELAVNEMGDSVYSTAVAANGVLYVTNRNTLYAVANP